MPAGMLCSIVIIGLQPWVVDLNQRLIDCALRFALNIRQVKRGHLHRLIGICFFTPQLTSYEQKSSLGPGNFGFYKHHGFCIL
jgi:hypothetical protein